MHNTFLRDDAVPSATVKNRDRADVTATPASDKMQGGQVLDSKYFDKVQGRHVLTEKRITRCHQDRIFSQHDQWQA